MSFEHDRRVIIYPAYLNSKRTVSEGRRIPKESACEDPTAPEIEDCCILGLNLPAEKESKSYSRDFYARGRVRVRLFNPDGTPTNPDIPNRKILFVKVAELVPRHPGRQGKKPGQTSKLPEASQAGPSKAIAAAPPSAAPTSTSAKAGKGKKKRK